MYILDSVCENYSFVRLMYFIKSLLQVVTIVVPIILIVVLTIKFVKAIASSEEEMKKAVNSSIKVVISAVIIFFIPIIVGLVMSLLGNTNFKQAACWNDATKERVEYLKVSYNLKKVESKINITKKNINKSLESFGDVVDDSLKKDTEKTINEIENAIKKRDVDKANSLLSKLEKNDKKITVTIKEYRWKEIMEKAPKVAASSGGSTEGIKFIMSLEGNEGYCNNGTGYRAADLHDGTITVGYGITNYDQEIATSLGFGNYFPLHAGDCVPINVIEQVFTSTMASFYDSVNNDLKKYNITDWKQNQIDALVSLGYNKGANVSSKAIAEYASGGKDAMWAYMKQIVKPGTIHEAGLKKRRAMEWELFQYGDYNIVSNEGIASKYY